MLGSILRDADFCAGSKGAPRLDSGRGRLCRAAKLSRDRHLQLPESETSLSDQTTTIFQGSIAKRGDAALFGDRHLRLLESVVSTAMPFRDRLLLWFVL